MSDSTLDLDNIPVGNDRSLGQGHGTRALGPSDNSDSGSDVAGGPDIGFDSDTDAEGTGERAGVEMASAAPASETGFDQVEEIPAGDAEDQDIEADVDASLREERRDWARSGASAPPSSRP
jgi:hypothetical protein